MSDRDAVAAIEARFHAEITGTEVRAEQRLYWSRRTPEERLGAMYELNRRVFRAEGIPEPQPGNLGQAQWIRRPKL